MPCARSKNLKQLLSNGDAHSVYAADCCAETAHSRGMLAIVTGAVPSTAVLKLLLGRTPPMDQSPPND